MTATIHRLNPRATQTQPEPPREPMTRIEATLLCVGLLLFLWGLIGLCFFLALAVAGVWFMVGATLLGAFMAYLSVRLASRRLGRRRRC
jgi:apolipoprotein N-acyltransferase